MTGSSWRQSRVALVVGALALLAGTPAVLASASVRNPWALGAATGLGAVVVAFAAMWQESYRRLAQRRDDQAFKTEDGCLVLAGGRLPRVRDITDPVLLGVHKATPVAVPAGGYDAGDAAAEGVPAYVPRDIDGGLRKRLASGGFVLLVGKAGTACARDAVRAVPPCQWRAGLPEWVAGGWRTAPRGDEPNGRIPRRAGGGL